MENKITQSAQRYADSHTTYSKIRHAEIYAHTTPDLEETVDRYMLLHLEFMTPVQNLKLMKQMMLKKYA